MARFLLHRITATATAVDGEQYRMDVMAEAVFGIREIAVAVGDRIVASRAKPPPETYFLLSARDVGPLPQTVEIRAYDPYGNIGRVNVTIP